MTGWSRIGLSFSLMMGYVSSSIGGYIITSGPTGTRKRSTREEKSKLYLKENGAYTLNKDKAVASLSTNGKPLDTHMDTVGIPDDNQMDTAGYTNDNQMSTWLTQDRIGKDRIGKESIKKYIWSGAGQARSRL